MIACFASLAIQACAAPVFLYWQILGVAWLGTRLLHPAMKPSFASNSTSDQVLCPDPLTCEPE